MKHEHWNMKLEIWKMKNENEQLKNKSMLKRAAWKNDAEWSKN